LEGSAKIVFDPTGMDVGSTRSRVVEVGRGGRLWPPRVRT